MKLNRKIGLSLLRVLLTFVLIAMNISCDTSKESTPAAPVDGTDGKSSSTSDGVTNKT